MFKMYTLNMLWSGHKEEVWLKRRQRNLYRQYIETIHEMSNTLFIQRFRLSKVTFEALVQDLRRKTSIKGSNEIPLEVKVRSAKLFSCFLSTNTNVKHKLTSHTHAWCNSHQTFVKCIKNLIF